MDRINIRRSVLQRLTKLSDRVFFADSREGDIWPAAVIIVDDMTVGTPSHVSVVKHDNDGDDGGKTLTKAEIASFCVPMTPSAFCEKVVERLQHKRDENNFEFSCSFQSVRGGDPERMVFRADYCVGRGNGYRSQMISLMLACQYPGIGTVHMTRTLSETIGIIGDERDPRRFRSVEHIYLSSDTQRAYEDRLRMLKGVDMNIPSALKNVPVLNDICAIIDMADSMLIGVSGEGNTCHIDYVDVRGVPVHSLINRYFRRHLTWNAEGAEVFSKSMWTVDVAPQEVQQAFHAVHGDNDECVIRNTIVWEEAETIQMVPLTHKIAEYLAKNLSLGQFATLETALKRAASQPGLLAERATEINDLHQLLFPVIAEA